MYNKMSPQIIYLLIICFFTLVNPVLGLDIDTSSPFLNPDFSKRISMDFQEAPLADVLKIFSQQSNMNLVTSAELANKRVTVYLDQVPVEQALEQILRANGLIYEVEPGSDIYMVKPLAKPEVEVITRVYPLKHATVNSAKLRRTLNVKAADGTEINPSTGTEDTGLVASLRAILTSNGKIVEDPRTNSLIITDIANNFPQIERTLERLDIPVPQILIEVEMLEVAKQTADLIGVKVGSTPLSFTGASRKTLYPWNENEVLRDGEFEFGTGTDDNSQYTVGTIDASGLTAIMQFLRTQSDAKNLARPRILTLNNETAEIKISTDEAIGLETVTVSAGGAAVGSTTTSAERVPTGVSLTVTPQANIENEEIIMAVAPKVIVARTGGTFQGVTFKDAEERGSQSILRVKSGDTIVIGGLMRTQTASIITKVPFLGDIPFVGGAFRHKDLNDTERELIIFITPILLDESAPLDVKNQTPPLLREQETPKANRDVVEKELSNLEKKE
jgi:type IV pilus assembly protein PilQ